MNKKALIDFVNNKITITKLKINKIFSAIFEGIIERFKEKTQIFFLRFEHFSLHQRRKFYTKPPHLKSVKYLYFTLIVSLCCVLINGKINPAFAGKKDKDATSELVDKLEKHKISHTVSTLSRFNDDDFRLAQYAQELTYGEDGKESYKLRRPVTTALCHSVWTGDNKTHLRARGICIGESIWPDPFTTDIFPLIGGPKRDMDWASYDATIPVPGCACHKSASHNGHSETQFIKDIKDGLKTGKADSIVKLFTNGNEDTKMSGLELFGSFDTCDVCLDELLAFHKEQKEGAGSIARHIIDRGHFKGRKEDAFVMIYHAYVPYRDIETYNAEDDEHRHELTYTGFYPQVHPGRTFKKKRGVFETPFKLVQEPVSMLSPNMLHGYIHHLGDRSIPYEEGFHFP